VEDMATEEAILADIADGEEAEAEVADADAGEDEENLSRERNFTSETCITMFGKITYEKFSIALGK